MVLSSSTLGAPPTFTLGEVDVLGCTFLTCLGVGSLFLLFPRPLFVLSQGGFVGAGGVPMIGLNYGDSLGVLSIVLLLTFGVGAIFLVCSLVYCCLPLELAPSHAASLTFFQ